MITPRIAVEAVQDGSLFFGEKEKNSKILRPVAGVRNDLNTDGVIFITLLSESPSPTLPMSGIGGFKRILVPHQ